MIAAKRITNTSVSHVVKRVDWTSGTVYVEYDHYIDDIIDQNFFVIFNSVLSFVEVFSSSLSSSTISLDEALL